MEITVEVKGLGNALKFVNQELEQIPKKLQIVCERLSEVGREVASQHFSEGGHGNDDWNVEVEQISDTSYRVVAFGESIGFLEFGAGTSTQADTFISQVGYPVYGGSYSEQNEGSFYKHGFWYYNNEKLTGIAPTHGMYHAFVQMQSRAKDIIREVFDDRY